MDYKFIKTNIETIVKLLISKRFEELWLNDRDQRITPNEIANAIDGYGEIMTLPHSECFDNIQLYPTNNPNQVAIDFDLWFDGAKSDLTLQCTIYNDGGKKYSVDDIRML